MDDKKIKCMSGYTFSESDPLANTEANTSDLNRKSLQDMLDGLEKLRRMGMIGNNSYTANYVMIPSVGPAEYNSYAAQQAEIVRRQQEAANQALQRAQMASLKSQMEFYSQFHMKQEQAPVDRGELKTVKSERPELQEVLQLEHKPVVDGSSFYKGKDE